MININNKDLLENKIILPDNYNEIIEKMNTNSFCLTSIINFKNYNEVKNRNYNIDKSFICLYSSLIHFSKEFEKDILFNNYLDYKILLNEFDKYIKDNWKERELIYTKLNELSDIWDTNLKNSNSSKLIHVILDTNNIEYKYVKQINESYVCIINIKSIDRLLSDNNRDLLWDLLIGVKNSIFIFENIDYLELLNKISKFYKVDSELLLNPDIHNISANFELALFSKTIQNLYPEYTINI